MTIHNKIASTILRIFIGLVFIASAILKYISIDIFDLFVFEHNLFSISVTETLTRLLITAELLIGIMLIFSIHLRIAYYTAILFLAGFTVYLFLLPYLFDVDIQHCHCFGEAIVLNRTESILKNIVLLVCLVFVSPKFSTFYKWETWVMLSLGAVIFIVFMSVNAPNYVYTLVRKDKIQIDIPTYESALSNSGKETEFTNGKQIICMYSTICQFCKRSAMKMHLIAKHNQLSEDKIKAVFWSGTPDSTIYDFFSDQKIPLIEYTTFRVDTFLKITDGSMPVILFSDNGKITHKANYVTLNEKEIVDFLSSERSLPQ
ncbi:MAG: hypothetical protein LBI60_01920 [Bacteroidales bacterium]|nr:hypothetical protein [Bacteroidales bacterium]